LVIADPFAADGADPFAATVAAPAKPAPAPVKAVTPPRQPSPPAAAASVVPDSPVAAEPVAAEPVAEPVAAAAEEPAASDVDESVSHASDALAAASVSEEPPQEDSSAAEAPAAAEPVPIPAPAVELQYDEDDAEDELTLVDQELTALPAEIIRARGMNIRRLDLSMNKLSSLESLAWPYGPPSWPALEELILDKNALTGLVGLGPAPLPKLRTLWLNNNAIDDLEALLTSIEKLAPQLTYLSMLRNPVAPDSYFSGADALSPSSGVAQASGGMISSSRGGDDSMESYARFRLYVCYRLKHLAFLDATPVTPEERKEATVRGAYCRVAKPQAPKPSGKSAASPSAAAAAASDSATSPLSPDSAARQSQVGVSADAKPPKVATFLAKGKPRYDGTNSEGNRFIMNDDL